MQLTNTDSEMFTSLVIRLIVSNDNENSVVAGQTSPTLECGELLPWKGQHSTWNVSKDSKGKKRMSVKI